MSRRELRVSTRCFRALREDVHRSRKGSHHVYIDVKTHFRLKESQLQWKSPQSLAADPWRNAPRPINSRHGWDKPGHDDVIKSMTIRDLKKTDWPAILRLNEESVHFLAPMDEAKLAKWSAAASYFRVVELEGQVAAFLMGFRKGDDYDGVNFAWFAQRYSDFVYVDRIVVAPEFRGRKLADLLYDDFESFARERVIRHLTCEVNVEPPNPVSLRFHEKRSFKEVGREAYAGKTVAMLHCPI